MSSDNVALLEDCANRLRVTSIEITSKANSGHPTSSASAAEIMATLFFAEMRYDAQKPRDVNADRFVMSKGHACPVLYAAWVEAGLLSRDDCMTLRHIDSDIEGHPTPRLSFIDVATGSLGQGLSLAAGMAVAGQKVDHASYRTYCLMGDGETAEGSVWEAAAFASHNKLDNLLAIVDINRLGQSRPTQLGHDIDTYAKRFAAFGWHTISVNGHNVTELLKAYEEAKKTKGKPTVILAKTYKGNGIEGVSDNEGYHGKALPKEKLNAIRDNLKSPEPHKWNIAKPAYDVPESNLRIGSNKLSSPPNYTIGDEVATRKAYGVALVKLADQNKRVIALDAEVSNSTFSEMVAKKHPEQYVECFIAEQNMVGVGIGLGCRERAIPFCSTFAAFFTRAADQIRMAAVSFANVKFCGSHVGVSIGEDGPSQMGLEDLALFRAIPGGVVLYPSDAVSTEYAVELVANQRGIAYIRSGRPNLPVIYANDEKFQIGQSKVVRQSQNDRVLVIGAGVTLAEAIKAHDQLNREGVHIAVLDIFSVQPIDRDTILAHAQRCGGRVLTVEDHYQAGGIGEAVSAALSDQSNIQIRRIFVQELPRSGAPDALLDRYGLSAKHIAEAVKKFLN
ncbi:Transket-pyr domain-containing protein [Aphelenchoides besseyi]|nr:Transket-pyr domain-containing protein [Aphelenchoides besseyi]